MSIKHPRLSKARLLFSKSLPSFAKTKKQPGFDSKIRIRPFTPLCKTRDKRMVSVSICGSIYLCRKSFTCQEMNFSRDSGTILEETI